MKLIPPVSPDPPAPGRVNTTALLGIMLFISLVFNNTIGYLESSVISSLQLGQYSFWLVLVLCFALAMPLGNQLRQVALALFALLIGLRIALLLQSDVEPLYKLVYSAIVALAAMVFFTRTPKTCAVVLKLFVAANLVVLILQFLGVSEFLHSWNTLFVDLDGVLRVRLQPVLFVSLDALNAPFQQMRSPGLLYSSAVAGPFIMLVMAYRWGGRIGSLGVHDLAIILTVFFLMAKISILFMIFMAATRYWFAVKGEKQAWKERWVAILMAFSMMLVLFPGVVIGRLGFEQLIASASIRVADFLLSAGVISLPNGAGDLKDVAASQLSLKYEDDATFGGMSGLWALIYLLPVGIWLLMRLRAKIRTHELSIDEGRRCKYMLFALGCAYLATPISGIAILAFMCGPLWQLVIGKDSMRRVIIR